MEALEMERPMTEWNDDRLDELNGRVKEGFARVDKRFEQVDKRFVRLEGEMKEGFKAVPSRHEMNQGFAQVRVEFRAVNDRLDRLGNRLDRVMYTLMVTGLGLIGTALVAVLK